jgi:hypothetical protein
MKNKNVLPAIICIIFISLVFIPAVSALTIRDITSSPEQVVPGGIVEASMVIENTLTFDTQNIDVSLDLTNAPFAPYQSSSEKFLDSLNEGDKETFTFRLISLPQTESGIYKIPVNITYQDTDGKSYSKSGLISLTVNAKPELKVSVDDSVVLIKGQESILSIKVVNSGLSSAKFTYLSISGTSGVKILNSNEQYAGDINSDDFNTVQFQVYINPTALGIINLPLTLRYKDATNKEFIETKTITVNTYTIKEAQSLGLVKKQSNAILILIIILIAGYFIRRYIIKKRKIKEKKLQGSN